MALIIYNN